MEMQKNFVKMTQREFSEVAHWLEDLRRNGGSFSNEERCFLERVSNALDIVRHPYWIATVPAKLDEAGQLTFDEEAKDAELSAAEWFAKAKDYDPMKGSTLATQEELFLYYGYSVAQGKISLEQISEIPYEGMENYSLYGVDDAPSVLEDAPHKLVRKNSIFAICGGSYNKPAKKLPMAEVSHVLLEDSKLAFTAGVIVLLE